jgi:hypothetical protein
MSEYYSTEADEEDETTMASIGMVVEPQRWHDGFTLKSTVKEGFRVEAITIRCDYPHTDAPTPYDYRHRALELYRVGQAACDEMNDVQGGPLAIPEATP